MLWCQKQLAVDDGIVLVDDDIWKEIIKLYPSLVKCVHSNSEAVLTELQKVLLAYNDMLSIPKSSSLANGSWAYRLLLSPNFYIWLVNLAIFHYILVIVHVDVNVHDIWSVQDSIFPLLSNRRFFLLYEKDCICK